MPAAFGVEVAPAENISALAYPAAVQRRAGVTLILAHGAGAGQSSGFMTAYAEALAARGIDIVTFNFLYTERARRLPDPNNRLESCYRAVIETVQRRGLLSPTKLVIGGKSMGGRIASRVAAGGIGDLVGLLFLGYPLHPPGRPDRLRAAHLREVKAPMLFVQGSRDAFGTPAELHPIIQQIGPSADLYVVEGGDHSFKVLKRVGILQQEAHRAIQDRVAAWLRAKAAAT
jgi:predicted alpha/beta-hydrolase family hydrolase